MRRSNQITPIANFAIVLINIQGLCRGQTVTVFENVADKTTYLVKPHGDTKTYSIHKNWIKFPEDSINYPRCQEISKIWHSVPGEPRHIY